MKPEQILNAMAHIGDDLIADAESTRKTSEMPFGTEFPQKSASEEAGGQESATEPAGDKIADIRSHRRWLALAASLFVIALAGGTFLMLSRLRMGNSSSSSAPAIAEAVEMEAAKDEAVAEETMAEETAGAAAPMAAESAAEYAEESAGASGMTAANAAAEEIADEAESSQIFGAADVQAEESAPASAGEASDDTVADTSATAAEEELRIRVSTEAGDIVFLLNDSQAARSLYDQLPLTIDTEPYSTNEITFHAPEALDVTDGIDGGGTAGMLGYFAPWNNVVLYYGDFEAYPGLYILGEAVEGAETISEIRGKVTITADE